MNDHQSTDDLRICNKVHPYMWSLMRVADSARRVDLAAVHVCMLLLLRENDTDNVIRFANSPIDEQVTKIEQYLCAHYPEEYEEGVDISTIVINLLESDAHNNIRQEREQARLEIVNLNQHLTAERVRCADQIARWESANAALVGKVADLQAQLEAANARPATLIVHNGTASMPGSVVAELDEEHALTPAKRVVDWNSLPDEHASYIVLLHGGTAKWSELPTPTRRSITLYAIAQLAHDGSLTMAEYADNKPSFMPTGGALAQMFGLRWSELVANAVTFAEREVRT